MSYDPFFPAEALRWDLISRPGPAARLVNESGLFCGSKIHPDCLHIGVDGSVRVSLSLPAETWFRTLCQLGEVLHLMPAAMAGVWMWQGRCHCCDKEHWTIEIGDHNGQVGLAITVGDDRLEKEWRDLMVAMMP